MGVNFLWTITSHDEVILTRKQKKNRKGGFISSSILEWNKKVV